MDIDTHDELETGLETKAGIPSDAVVTHAELMRAFEEFKEANEQKLAEKRSIDVVLEEKIARIDNTISTQTQRLDVGPASQCCAIPIAQDPTCCFTRPSA